MPQEQNPGIKLRHLKIENFKALDSLELDFPAPRFPDEPDVVVLGSKNGLGKTSVLEACVLLFLSCGFNKEIQEYLSLEINEFPVNLPNLFIRAGSNNSRIEGKFTFHDLPMNCILSVSQEGQFQVKKNEDISGKIREFLLKNKKSVNQTFISDFLYSLTAMVPESLILPSFLYLHSYRKIQEGNPDLSSIVDDRFYHKRFRYQTPISSFKMEILRLMMGRVGLFEGLNEDDSEESINQLNQLLERYTEGFIEKLRPSVDNTVEFRVTLKGGGPSFSFDGLSSGQKEIISTLFLIWRYTKDNPGIVLIDEPELHLNAEWQRDFVQQLYKIAPRNQYILATHSEDIVDSVPPDRRFLLVPQEAGRC